MKENLELCNHHKNYSIYRIDGKWINYYSDNLIESLEMVIGEYDSMTDSCENEIIVRYKSKEEYRWKTKYISGYNMGQFGIAVSSDGATVFAQTWDNGLFCFDAKTGKRIWRTKSRRGITSIFVGDSTITVQLHDYAMQLIDIKTGEVLKEKRPCTAWGFTTLNDKYIVCQATARKWEIIEAETLEAIEAFTNKEFTGNHTDFCINHISLCENGDIRVSGFQNAWNNSNKMLPNIEFEYFLKTKLFK